MNGNRQQIVMATMLLSLFAPRLKELGINLGTEDALVLMTGGLAAWHGLMSSVEKYFPPPWINRNPTPGPTAPKDHP